MIAFAAELLGTARKVPGPGGVAEVMVIVMVTEKQESKADISLLLEQPR